MWIGENASGAARFRKRCVLGVPGFAVHPGSPLPAGAVSVAPVGSAVEKTSTSMPPGVPVPGSSALPTGGKRKAGSLERNTSFSRPLAERLSRSFVAAIG
jgi:hypothetical protein